MRSTKRPRPELRSTPVAPAATHHDGDAQRYVPSTTPSGGEGKRHKPTRRVSPEPPSPSSSDGDGVPVSCGHSDIDHAISVNRCVHAQGSCSGASHSSWAPAAKTPRRNLRSAKASKRVSSNLSTQDHSEPDASTLEPRLEPEPARVASSPSKQLQVYVKRYNSDEVGICLSMSPDATISALVKAISKTKAYRSLCSREVMLRLKKSGEACEGFQTIREVAGSTLWTRPVAFLIAPAGPVPRTSSESRGTVANDPTIRHLPPSTLSAQQRSISSVSVVYFTAASSPIKHIIDAIRAGEVKQINGHLYLPAHLGWPGAPNNVLYVRNFYDLMYATILRKCAPPPPRGSMLIKSRRILSGQPGIGKSVFGWYLIYRLLTEHSPPAIIYAETGSAQAYLFQPDAPTVEVPLPNLHVFVTYVKQRSLRTVLVCDSFIPPAHDFPIVVLAAPSVIAEARRDLLNRYAAELCFPVHTVEELKDMRSVAFPHLSESTVLNRVALWGPIPRFAFAEPDPTSAGRLKDRLEELSVTAIEEAGRATSYRHGMQSLPHRLFITHALGEDESLLLHPSQIEYYCFDRSLIASQVLARWLIERAIAEKNRRAEEFFASKTQIPLPGSASGVTWKAMAVRALTEGETFLCRLLSSAKHVSLTIPKLEVLRYSSVEDLRRMAKETRRRLLLPIQKNNESVDAVIWHPKLKRYVPLNCTTSPTHGISLPGLLESVQALGWNPRSGWPQSKGSTVKARDMTVPLFFVVPREHFDKSWQKLRTVTPTLPQGTRSVGGKGTKQLAHNLAALEKHLVQYVLAMTPGSATAHFQQLLRAHTPSLHEQLQATKYTTALQPYDCISIRRGAPS